MNPGTRDRRRENDADVAEAAILQIVAGIEQEAFREAVETRICGACGCLCRSDESCPSCILTLGGPREAVRWPA